VKKKLTAQDADAARKVLKAWEDQEKEKAALIAKAFRAAREAAVESWMAEKGDLTGWALEQWKRDKEAGYGRGMTEDQAVKCTLGSLRLAVDKVNSVEDYVAARDSK
jgi:hypothetical protein